MVKGRIVKELISNIYLIGSGITITLKLLFGGLFVGIIIGTILAILRYNGIFSKLINQLISILRGTPLILQLAFIYFSAPSILGIKFSVISAGITAFGLNSSAYIAEILKAGIESLPKGQFEVSRTLQIPTFYMWKDIILPQAIRNVLPAIINEIITLLKETAIITTIGGMDIMRMAQTLASEKFTYFMPLCIAGMYYYGLVILIEYIGKKIAKKVTIC